MRFEHLSVEMEWGNMDCKNGLESWTSWTSRDSPTGNGDYEFIRDILDYVCYNPGVQVKY